MMMTSDFFLITVLITCFHVLGFANAIHVVLNGRTSQGTIAWILCLLLFPYLSIPLYWILGPRKFNSYTRKLAKAWNTHQSYLEEELKIFHTYAASLDRAPHIERTFDDFDEWGITSGNDASLYVDGQSTFDEIFRVIDTATEYVLINFYIIRDDELGMRLKSHLIARRKAGVRIYFMFDSIGSISLSESYLQDLRNEDIEVSSFRTTRGIKNRWKLNFRNHRKIVVVDGHTAFVGGFNIGDEYLGKDPSFGYWRDTHIKVQGPAVLGIQITFAKDWFWACDNVLSLSWNTSAVGDMNMLPISTGPVGNREACTLLFLSAINESRERFWIASPYLVPDEQIQSALTLAVLRGVDVRILVPERPDHLIVNLAGMTYWRELLDAGVKIYRYKKGFLHQKAFLVDDWWAAVGTANLDNRSLRLNFELTVNVFNDSFTATLAESFETDYHDSEQITLEDCTSIPLLIQILGRICKLFSPLL